MTISWVRNPLPPIGHSNFAADKYDWVLVVHLRFEVILGSCGVVA